MTYFSEDQKTLSIVYYVRNDKHSKIGLIDLSMCLITIYMY